jgi:hypothetical protein
MRGAVRAVLAAGVLAVLAGSGCDGTQAAGPGLMATARLAGDWQAETAVFTAGSVPAAQFDVISQDGQLQLRMRDGRFIQSVLAPGRAVLTRTGTVLVAGDHLVLTDDGGIGSRSIPFSFDGRALRFRDPGHTFDFDGTGVFRPAVLDVVLIR